jgi:hypothetical protein
VKTFLAILASLIVLAATAIAQTTTTNCDTSATVNGDHVDGSTRCTSTDDSAERAAQAKRQADQDKAWQDFGTNLGNMIAQIGIKKNIKKYCEQHQGESWNWQVNGQQLSGTCPGTRVWTKAQIVDGMNAFAKKSNDKDGKVAYNEAIGDKLITHSERCSAMRFHANTANPQFLSMLRAAGINRYVYTNDADLRFEFDLTRNREVPAEIATAAGTGSSERAAMPTATNSAAPTKTVPPCPDGTTMTITSYGSACLAPPVAASPSSQK